MLSPLDTEEGSIEELRAFARYCERRGMAPHDAAKMSALYLVSFVFSEPEHGPATLELLKLVEAGIEQAMTKRGSSGKQGAPC